LKRNGEEEIEFLAVPHPGRETDPLVTQKHRLVEWGDRLYLSVADQRELGEFCREVLAPSSPSRAEDAYGPFLRVSDRDKPRMGLPRLPGVRGDRALMWSTT
jgi:hypothetical protein